MINIFAALRKAQGEISGILPEVLETEPTAEPEPAGPTGDQANGQGNASPLPGTLSATSGDDESLVSAVLGQPEDRAGERSQDIAFSHDRVCQLPLQVKSSSPLLPYDNTNRVAAEQYRIIRTRLVQHPKQPRLILISSGGPGDGKSVTSVNIAGALSLKGEGDVLLMDADFRRSTIHDRLGLRDSPGLAEVLSGDVSLEDALVRTEQFPRLYVVTAGQPRGNPSELLDSERWKAACEVLRSRFRYVIADSPPVASVADYELLQASFDGVIMVMRPDHTKRQQCLKALELVPKQKLIGVVMNCVPAWFLSRLTPYAGYYYGLYDRHGTYGSQG